MTETSFSLPHKETNSQPGKKCRSLVIRDPDFSFVILPSLTHGSMAWSMMAALAVDMIFEFHPDGKNNG